MNLTWLLHDFYGTLLFLLSIELKCAFQRVQVLARTIIPSNQSNAFAKFDDHKFLHCNRKRTLSQVKHFRNYELLLWFIIRNWFSTHTNNTILLLLFNWICFGGVSSFPSILLAYCFCLFVMVHAHISILYYYIPWKCHV